jgi:hypothetical protein
MPVSHILGQAPVPGVGTLQIQGSTLAAEVTANSTRSAEFILRDRLHGHSFTARPGFRIVLNDGSEYSGEEGLQYGEMPVIDEVPADSAASRRAAQLPQRRIHAALASADGRLRVDWSLVAIENTPYIRQIVTVTAAGGDLPIKKLELVDLALSGAQVSGSVPGSPIVAGSFFAGVEHPMSKAEVKDGHANAWIERELPLRAGQSVTYSAVFGVAHDGQLRRDFLSYIETERAHPYRTFLHYNSWYDLGYFNPYDEAGALDRIHAFGEQLSAKRGVKLDSFLFDDGWDNHASLWKFNSGFPHGFAPLKQAAAKLDAAPGVWMSPWGGYDGPKKERIAYGRTAGYEIVADGYALSGPKYYAAFRDVCLDMIRRYGVNQFKFDGTGNANAVFPGSEFDSDFAAAIHLIGELRTARPDVFINVTTGTWPSPFWLLYADSIWRGGEDDSVAGVGPYRERWITYRDAATYQNVVQKGPLYPLNSLMLHGMIYAQHHRNLDKDPGNDFRNEVRSYFGTGTQLQEMYVTPSLLTSGNWDDLAEAAKWSRSNADVLKDTHWMGGDPAKLEVYGWASWAPRKGIIVLRNPSDRAQSITLSLQQALELPANSPTRYKVNTPWQGSGPIADPVVDASGQREYKLAPFEVLTIEFTPANAD